MDISKISVVWLRNFDINELNFGQNDLVRTFSLQQWNTAFQIFQSNLTCEWINSPQASIHASDRAKQLSVAKAMGFDIPATLITNDPMAARDFYKSHDNDIIIKALYDHSVEIQGKIYYMYTHRVLTDDLSKLVDLIYAPCVLQQRLLKKLELRITVVGDQVFAAELDPQSSVKGCDDVHRSFSADFPIPVRVFNLPDTISERCISLVESLGLKYGAIDFIVDKDDRLVFLEVNPTGDWYWIEQKVRLPITEAMVNLLGGFA